MRKRNQYTQAASYETLLELIATELAMHESAGRVSPDSGFGRLVREVLEETALEHQEYSSLGSTAIH